MGPSNVSHSESHIIPEYMQFLCPQYKTEDICGLNIIYTLKNFAM